jgi:putative membrane protein insertion efficiency factor
MKRVKSAVIGLFFVLTAPLRLLFAGIKWILKLPIRAYRRWISPSKGGACCRFTPTCSEYALQAIDEWGLLAVFLIVWRILRCNPFCRGGEDPVPTAPWNRRRRARKEKDSLQDAHDTHDAQGTQGAQQNVQGIKETHGT